MMQVDEKLVKYLAHLSRIACPDEKLPGMVGDLEKIVAYFEELNSVDTDDVETCSYVSQYLNQTPLRDDTPHNTISQEEAFNDMPNIAMLYRIPQVQKDS